jgi:cell division inhibitor SulA/protein ImuA
MNAAIDQLLQHPGIWRGEHTARITEEVVPSGFDELDALLPGGGWSRGGLTEILLEREGIGELSLLMPALARLSKQGAWLTWISPPHIPYAPALSAVGINLDQLLIARPQSAADAWWTAEQAMRSGACSAVLAWLDEPDEKRMRRMQLGAETGRCLGVLFRPVSAAQQRSMAALRLRLAAMEHGVAVHILKRRGGQVSKPVLLRLHSRKGDHCVGALPALSVVKSSPAAVST